MRGLLLFSLCLGLAHAQGCSACSAVDEADLVPRVDSGTSPVDAGPAVRPDGGPLPGDAGPPPRGLGDPNDCGGAACDHLEACVDGMCECRSGRMRVGGECIDLGSDPNNCGEPGHVCGSETVCAAGRCREGCPDGAVSCDGACVSTFIDIEHCGSCGNRCDRDEFCWGGTCREYTGGAGCTACPCPTCSGDLATCCPVSGRDGFVACIADERCPGS